MKINISPSFSIIYLRLSLLVNREVLFLFLMSLVTFPVVANDVNFTDSSNGSVTNSEIDKSILKQFNINEEEWNQYQTELKGARGLWSPNIHPLMVLGMREGITEQERKKLAKKMAVVQFERVKRELAFEKAVREEGLKLYGHLPLFVIEDELPTRKVKSNITVDKATESPTGKLQLFTDLNCVECKLYIDDWTKKGNSFELYVLGSKAEISRFAMSMGISPSLVPSQIQVNRVTKKQLDSLKITKLPQIRRLMK